MKDCVQGLAYLHKQAGIIHRDIKPQNILLCSGKHLAKESSEGVPYVAKFCDFGVSEKLKAPFEQNDVISKTAGTFHFFAPECCDPNIETHSGRAADIWALGVTLYCLIFNQLPYWDQDMNEYQILDVILNEPVKLPESTDRRIIKDDELTQ